MSEKAAAAQKWAEAKEARDVAADVLSTAEEAYRTAVETEVAAWDALEALAGRSAKEIAPVLSTATGNLAVTPEWRQTAGNLPIRPLG